MDDFFQFSKNEFYSLEINIKMMEYNYIYLLQEDPNEKVYKIGRTKQENVKRIRNYPNGTKLLYQRSVTDCIKAEEKLLQIFNERFKLHHGREYFSGNCNQMIDIIHGYISQNPEEIPEIKTPCDSVTKNLKKEIILCEPILVPKNLKKEIIETEPIPVSPEKEVLKTKILCKPIRIPKKSKSLAEKYKTEQKTNISQEDSNRISNIIKYSIRDLKDFIFDIFLKYTKIFAFKADSKITYYQYQDTVNLWKQVSVIDIISYIRKLFYDYNHNSYIHPLIVKQHFKDSLEFYLQKIYEENLEKYKVPIGGIQFCTFEFVKFNMDDFTFPQNDNKILDIETLLIRERTFRDFYSTTGNCKFVPEENFDIVNDFFLSLSEGDKDFSYFLKCLCGLFIIGQTYRGFIQFVGGNSDTTNNFIELLLDILGEKLSTKMDIDFLVTNHDRDRIYRENFLYLKDKRIILFENNLKENKPLVHSTSKFLTEIDRVCCKIIIATEFPMKRSLLEYKNFQDIFITLNSKIDADIWAAIKQNKDKVYTVIAQTISERISKNVDYLPVCNKIQTNK
jgi:hypothetical protein